MAVNIGPKIGIDGEAQFRKEINGIIQQSKTLASEMKAVTSAFDANDKSQEALAAQTKVLTKQIETQQQRVNKLTDGLNAAAKQFGENDARTQKWQQAVNEATAELNRMKSQLSGLENSIGDVGDAMDDASRSALSFKDVFSANAIVEAAKSIGSAISDVVESTTEYRKIIGTLETSSQEAGYTAEQTAEAYGQLYVALGDDQTAATATANLQALKLGQQDLMNMLELVTGAWATYGDSIPIDSLAESINETIRSGTVTGTFADVLNWGTQEGEKFGVTMKANTEANKAWNDAVADAETAEDYFNLALQSASSEAERANIVMQAMASQGLAKTAEAWYENNKDIVDANNAQLEFTENAAEFSERVSPAVNEIKEGFNGIFEEILNLTEGIDFSAVAEEIRSGFSYFTEEILPEIANFAKYILDNKDTIISGITGIGAAFITWNVTAIISSVATEVQKLGGIIPAVAKAIQLVNTAIKGNWIAIVITAIVAATTALVTLWNTNEDFRNAVIEIGQQIAEFVSGVVNSVVGFFTETVPQAFEAFKSKAAEIWEGVKTAVSETVDAIVGFFTETIPNAFNAVIEFVKTNWQGLLLLIVNPFAGAFKLLYDNFDGFRNAVNSLVENIKQFFSNLATSIANTVGGIRDSVVSGIQDAVSFITSLPGQALQWGKDFIQGFIDGITSMIDGVVGAVSGIADTISSWLHFSRPDVGPLRQYESWMPDMMQGMAKGIRENSWRLEQAMNAATSNLQANVNINGMTAAGGSMNMGGVSITVNPAPGMDVNALADAVAYKLQAMTQRKAATW
ncbi:MAG TPA: hypothetical protein H9860_01445 [Candidatus Gemmiger faecavium]|nr:hypothetical protein [Candidatus Gemmiger faecavium]